VIDERQGVFLDPDGGEVLLLGDPICGPGWLEFHLPSGVAVTIERS